MKKTPYPGRKQAAGTSPCAEGAKKRTPAHCDGDAEKRPVSARFASAQPASVRENAAPPEGVVVGRGAVLELLKSGRPVEKLFLQRGEREGSISLIAAKALAAGIPLVECEREKLDKLACGVRHQGVAAFAAEKETVSPEELLQIAEQRGEPPFLLLLDGVEDPGNLGAIIRCAEGAGVHGIILPKRRSAPLSPAVYKSSAGALSHIAVCRVPGIPTAIDFLKKRGLWIYGADMGGTPFQKTDWSGPAALVLGAEGAGISRLAREKCDFIVSIPMYGKVESFNVACAAAVLLCDAAAKRHRENG